jgi:hypothetical protein
MKTTSPTRWLHTRRAQRGSLLPTAAVTAAVIAILMGGMITYLSNEYILNVRSHRWTQALSLAEGGIEMSFAEFNNYYLTGQSAFSASRGWTSAGGGSYYRYVSSFTNANGDNVGLVYAYVNGVGTANPYLFAYGGCATLPHGPMIYRAVESRLASSAMFPAGMVAKRKIDMNGNNVTTDSYDSTDPTKSTSGQYDAAKKQANGDIASNDTVTNTVDVALGNANIYGRVLLSPSGSVTMGPSGSIGPTFANPATTVAAAQANGWVRNDFQVDIPDVTLPSGAATWAAMPSGSTITSGDYKGTSITSSKTISGNVRLYLTDSQSIKLNGNDGITVSVGSSLTVYAAGSLVLTGNGVINDGNRPIQCQIYGLSSCTQVKVAGNGVYIGTVYAPNAALEIKGGGSSGEVAGAIVADTITMTGGTIFHYDESLRTNGPGASYNIASWKSFRWTGGAWISD